MYSLFRQDDGDRTGPVAPGAARTAKIVVLRSSPGNVGSGGSRNWIPVTLVTTPPGDTRQLSTAWPAGLSVLRQDAATNKNSWVRAFASES